MIVRERQRERGEISSGWISGRDRLMMKDGGEALFARQVEVRGEERKTKVG